MALVGHTPVTTQGPQSRTLGAHWYRGAGWGPAHFPPADSQSHTGCAVSCWGPEGSGKAIPEKEAASLGAEPDPSARNRGASPRQNARDRDKGGERPTATQKRQ